MYSDRKICIISEYNYIIVLRCVVQKLCVAKNSVLSIANLRYNYFLIIIITVFKFVFENTVVVMYLRTC